MHSSWQKHHVFFIAIATLLLQACGKPDLDSSTGSEPRSMVVIPTLEEKLFSDVPSGKSFNQLTSDATHPSERERLARFNYLVFGEFLRSHAQSPTPLADPTVRVRFELFADTAEEIELDTIQMSSPEKLIAKGRLAQDPQSMVTLELFEDSLTADIVSPRLNEFYKIRPLGQGIHVIQTQGSPIETDMISPPGENEPDEPGDSTNDSPTSDSSSLPDPIIDVLVAYTPRARIEQGGVDGMMALIQKGVADANRAFEDSGIAVRVRLVGTLETKQNERRDLTRDLHALMGKNDGLWDEVHAERDRLKADQVSLVAVYQSEKSLGGIGYFKARADSAFTLLRTSAFNHYTFAHELGHNLGLDHSDGWRNPKAGFSTIMAYGNDRICRFSNPELTYNGELTGDQRHNEAAIINRNAPKVAAFR